MSAIFFRETPFVPYGSSHWTVLLLFAIAAVVLVIHGRRTRGSSLDRKTRRVFAAVLLIVQLSLQVYSMLPGQWDLGLSLPFQLCDLAWMVAVHALWTGRPWAYGLLYYWGLTLTSQAVITPQLDFDFPHVQFLMFWFSHCLVVLAAVYMTWGGGWRPTWRAMALALSATVGWGFVMLAFNSLAGTNYLYVSHKPPGKSILDVLGDWPYYLVAEVLIIAALWGLMTAPWVSRGRGREADRICGSPESVRNPAEGNKRRGRRDAERRGE